MTKETELAQHTPGPWQQFKDGGTIENVGSSGRSLTYGPAYSDCVWGPLGPGHGLIADCSPSGQSPTVETLANARLIAAAPDMLRLIEMLAGNDPNEPIADSGETVFDLWKHDAKALLARVKP